jgi:hypothetical protein
LAFSDTDYIGSLQLADRNFGQGPHAFSRAAIRDSSNVIVDGFRIIGGSNVSYSRHVFDRIFALHDDLETNQIEARTDNGIPTMYQYNSRSYFGMGGKYNSRDGTWSVFSFRGSPAVRDWEEVVTPSPPPGPVPQYLTSERFLDAEQVFDKGYPIKSIVQNLTPDGELQLGMQGANPIIIKADNGIGFTPRKSESRIIDTSGLLAVPTKEIIFIEHDDTGNLDLEGLDTTSIILNTVVRLVFKNCNGTKTFTIKDDSSEQTADKRFYLKDGDIVINKPNTSVELIFTDDDQYPSTEGGWVMLSLSV